MSRFEQAFLLVMSALNRRSILTVPPLSVGKGAGLLWVGALLALGPTLRAGDETTRRWVSVEETAGPLAGLGMRLGPGWSVYLDPETGSPTMLVGPGIPLGAPIQADVAGVARARALLEELADLLGVDEASTFHLERAVSVRNAAGHEVVTIHFKQTIGGLDVWHRFPGSDREHPALVKFQFNGTLGRLVLLGSDAVPNLRLDPEGSRLAEDEAVPAALAGLREEAASVEKVASRSYIAVEAGRRFLAREVEIVTADPPHDYRFVFNAHTGTLEEKRDDLRHVDVVGSVSAGSWDHPGGTFEVRPSRALRVSVPGGGSAATDGGGSFSISHSGTTPVTVTGRFLGDWAVVSDQSGNGNLSFTQSATPGVPAAIILNGTAGSEFESAEAAGYHWATATRFFLQERIAGYSGNPALPVNVNGAGTCNAFYNGTSLNLLRAGGGCNNAAYQEVIAHEYAHAFHRWFHGSTTPGGFSEGIGDHLGMYVSGQRVVGRNFLTNGNAIRDYRPGGSAYATQWPCSTCSVHTRGQVWAGFAMDLRDNLIAAHGGAAGIDRAERITIAQFASNPADEVAAVAGVFILDDDDGDLTNGTPDCAEIRAAAARHSLPVPAALPSYCPPRSCAAQVGCDLRVDGPGTPGTSLVFAVSLARPGSLAWLAIGADRGEFPFGPVRLCVLPFLSLAMPPVDSEGTTRLVIPLPGFPAGISVGLHAQVFMVPPSLSLLEIQTSNVAAFDVYSVSGPPFTVTSVSPTSAGPGAPVTIQGSGFGTDPSRVTVYFDETPVPPTSVTDGEVRLVLPHLPDDQLLPMTVQVGVPRVGAGDFTFQPPVPATGPIPGWVLLTFPTVRATMDPGLPDLVRTLGARLAWADIRIRSALCIVPPGVESSFIASAGGPAGASDAEQDVYVSLEARMGDPGFPNDPRRANQWNLDLVGGPLVQGPTPPLVAVLDSGVFFRDSTNRQPHLDLTNPDGSSRLTVPAGVDLDLTGSGRVPQTGGNRHGTHVTGVIAAVTDNARNVTGMTLGLSVMPVKAWQAGEFTDQGSAVLARAIGTAAAQARALGREMVVNISAGMPAQAALRDALDSAFRDGIAIVKSAGNRDHNPTLDVSYINDAAAADALYPDIVIVSALDQTRAAGALQIWPDSCRTRAAASPPKRQVDLAAPGDNIVSLTTFNQDSGPLGLPGTSQAAPHVSAALGIVWSWTPRRAGEDRPSWRNRVIDMLLQGCVRDIGVAGRDLLFGNGSLDMNGRMAFHSGPAGSPTVRAQRVYREPRPTTPPTDAEYQRRAHWAGMNPRWSPDRRAMVYDVPLPTGQELRVQALDEREAPQGAAVPILAGEICYLGAFEPAGRWVAFVRREGVWAMKADGTGAPVELYTPGAGLVVAHPVWSPDGERIAVSVSGSIVVFRVLRGGDGAPTGGADSILLLPAEGANYLTPAWSPDGNRLAVTRAWTDTVELREYYEIVTVEAAGGGNQIRITTDGWRYDGNGSHSFGPGWTTDGRRIAFHTMTVRGRPAAPEYRHSMRLVPAQGGTPAEIFVFREGAVEWFDTEIPMGVPRTAICHSAVDGSRF